MAAVLVIVALVSAVTTMRFAVHGREVTVPDFLGTIPAQARAIAENAGLEAQVEREYYSSTVSEGKVLSQMPAAGTVVRRGWEVRLALSLGPQRVSIPDVVGESERAASINIAQRGLQIGGTAAISMPGSVGDVIAQDPPANAKRISAPKINLLVAQAPTPQAFVMPSFVGQPLGSVSNTLKDAGFSVGRVTVAGAVTPQSPAGEAPAPQAGTSSTVIPSGTPTANPSPASIIISQDPTPGAKVVAGAAINFVVK